MRHDNTYTYPSTDNISTISTEYSDEGGIAAWYNYSADGETVHIFDMMGREIQAFKHSSNQALPTGIYLVKVGDHPARKVVVIR